MNLVRPVRQPKRPSPGEHPRQRGVVAHAERAVDLYRRVDHRDGRRGRGNLTRRDGALLKKNHVSLIAHTKIKK